MTTPTRTEEPGGAGSTRDERLIARSIELAGELMDRAESLTTPAERRRRARLRRLLESDGGPRFVFSLADRVLRPVDTRAAARELAQLSRGPRPGMRALDAGLLRLAGSVAPTVPGPVIATVAQRLRHETAPLVYPATPPALLGRRLGALTHAGRRPNVNLLGEAVLGWEEAGRRAAALEGLLGRPDVDCVSVKVSSVSTGLSLLDLEGSVDRVHDPLLRLYRAAAAFDPPKLVNLDMEEHRDLDLTLRAFTELLDLDELASLRAGVALQAYLPDSHAALDRLLGWAAERRHRGGAAVRVRLVKGANLAMEAVEAELRGWPQAPYATKAETDASYKALAERLIAAAAQGTVEVGIASHNLFDVAFALVVAEESGARIDIEMLAGMADAQAAAVAERTGGVLLYVPVTSKNDFRRNALAYLARRLDENATPEGFLRGALSLRTGSTGWTEQADRFADAVRQRHRVATQARHRQDRGAAGPTASPGWRNEPDTDLTIAANRRWALDALAEPPPTRPAPVAPEDVDQAMGRAVAAAAAWGATAGRDRRSVLERAAEVMADGRAEALSVMATETAKTFAEGDPEVSEAVDYARWYAEGVELLDALGDQLESEPLGVVVVTSPWNFPYAIPAGGVLAALAAANAVVLKPSPEARATGALLVDQLVEAGFARSEVQLVAASDHDAGRRLIEHPDAGGIVLTGSYETAGLFRRWVPGRRLLAETSGKNAMVVAATADVDQAVGDLVRSAFGHAGQKCSAASLGIVDASVHDDSPFLRQLRDATESLRVGPATDPATEVGPIVGPFTPALERALTRLDPGESWLVEPTLVDADARLWSPGVRLGVRPGSWAHLTEWFGPVLGIMRAADLDEALGWQNAVAFGLTGGLQSLDPAEQDRWAERVEAGNLYVNRTTTGAIVGRQPFGGWKASSVGPTAKAGGPNYLLGLRRWRDRTEVGVAAAARDYKRWWADYFSRESETAGLRSESNVLRYRPFHPGIVVRLAEGAPDDDAHKAAAAAELTGTPLVVSSAAPRPAVRDRLERGGVRFVVESAGALAARAATLGGTRLRLLGASEPEVLRAAADHGVHVLDEPVASHGRLELVRWLREQSVTTSLHRYGNVVYGRRAARPPEALWGVPGRPGGAGS